ncbi:NfeD family protein [Corynebacterium ulceribovis]|uniref:NfeD family protein n=1 Tax=Corynebacterium ulceribovis TaxID=487732 RepID=UPI000477BD58|nr:NfeD family protein [Corynebacterium ulceribovis]
MGALLWFIGAVVLALAELLALGDFSLLMLGLAAAITATLALVGVPLWVEVAVFVVSSIALLVGLRPFLKRAMDRHTPTFETGPQALEGKTALVLEPVDDHSGLIRLGGDVWSARALTAGAPLSVDEVVRVIRIEGNTAIVWKER